MPTGSKRTPRLTAASSPSSTAPKRAPKRPVADTDPNADQPNEAPPVKATKTDNGKEKNSNTTLPNPAGALVSNDGGSVLTPLQQWLQGTPRGPRRYRASGKPQFFSFDTETDRDPSDTDHFNAAAALPQDIGPDDWEELKRDCCYTFPRKRLTAAMRQKFGLTAPATVSNAAQQFEKATSEKDSPDAASSPIQHGDIVGIDAGYRCVGWHVAYGPPQDMWLIETVSEYGYCLPLEFCDAPPRYYGPDYFEGFSQFAFPSPALLFNLPSFTWEEGKDVILDFAASAYEAPPNAQKKKAKSKQQRLSDWTWYDEPQEPFAPDGCDGFFVLDCRGKTVNWLKGKASGVVPRYVQEALVLPRTIPFPVETFGKWKD